MVTATIDDQWHVPDEGHDRNTGRRACGPVGHQLGDHATGCLAELAGTMHPGIRSITLRHLLTHTSGMARDSGILDFRTVLRAL